MNSPLATLDVAARHASSLAWHPRADVIFAGGFEGALKAFSTTTWRPLLDWSEDHDAAVATLDISHDGARVASAGASNRVVVRDFEDGHVVTTIDHFDGAWFVPGRNDLLALTKPGNSSLYLYDIKLGAALTAFRTQAKPPVWPVFVTDESVVIAAVRGASELWHVGSGARVGALKPAEDVLSVCASGDRRAVLLLCTNGKADVVDVHTGTRLGARTFAPGHAYLAAHPSSERYATSGDGGVSLWRGSGAATRFEVGLKGVYQNAFSPDGKMLGNVAADGKLRVWSLV